MLIVGVWSRLLSSCISGICKWWILVLAHSFSTAVAHWSLKNVLVMFWSWPVVLWDVECCDVLIAVLFDTWGTYFWKETQVRLWRELNFDYTKLRNKWMLEKSRNYLIYYTQLTNLSLTQFLPKCSCMFLKIHSWCVLLTQQYLLFTRMVRLFASNDYILGSFL